MLILSLIHFFHRNIGQVRKGINHSHAHGIYSPKERSCLDCAESVNAMGVPSSTLFAKVAVLEHQPVPVALGAFKH